jgi:hypothetical protein
VTLPGLYRGICTVNDDPENLLRVKLLVPQVLGNAETNWAWPVVPTVVGAVPPGVGDPVWVAFEAGDINQPVWLGTWLTVGGAYSGVYRTDAGPITISGGADTQLLILADLPIRAEALHRAIGSVSYTTEALPAAGTQYIQFTLKSNSETISSGRSIITESLGSSVHLEAFTTPSSTPRTFTLWGHGSTIGDYTVVGPKLAVEEV